MKTKALILILSLLFLIGAAFAQDNQYSEEQLDEILQPIALYPDPLLAQVLPASAYPTEIEAAARWLKDGGKEDDIANQSWDESVKAVAHYPEVMQKLAADPEWTAALGEAFANQSEDVTESVQRLRRQAYDYGNLRSSKEQRVIDEDDKISILPATAEYLYVPNYDTQAVYSGWSPGYSFSSAFLTGPWLSFGFDWLGCSCFRYPSGYYWGLGSPLFLSPYYYNVGYIHNNYCRPNYVWRVNPQRYVACRPARTVCLPNSTGWRSNTRGWRGYQANGWRGHSPYRYPTAAQSSPYRYPSNFNSSVRQSPWSSTSRWNYRSAQQTWQRQPGGGYQGPSTRFPQGNWNSGTSQQRWNRMSQFRMPSMNSGGQQWNRGSQFRTPSVPHPSFNSGGSHQWNRGSQFRMPSVSRPSYSRPSFSSPSVSRPSFSRPSFSSPSVSRPSFSSGARQWSGGSQMRSSSGGWGGHRGRR